MERRQQNMLRGGVTCIGLCTCGCKYAGPQEGPDDSFYGGSSTSANKEANHDNYESKAQMVAEVFGGDYLYMYGSY